MTDRQLVEHDSAPRAAFDLMMQISSEEATQRGEEHVDREYWIKLYAQCHSVVHGGNAESILGKS